MTAASPEFSCNSAEISLLRHHAGIGIVGDGGPGSLSPDARLAVVEALRAKGLVDIGGRYTERAWTTLQPDHGHLSHRAS